MKTFFIYNAQPGAKSAHGHIANAGKGMHFMRLKMGVSYRAVMQSPINPATGKYYRKRYPIPFNRNYGEQQWPYQIKLLFYGNAPQHR